VRRRGSLEERQVVSAVEKRGKEKKDRDCRTLHCLWKIEILRANNFI
jgi:hypothetical protein